MSREQNVWGAGARREGTTEWPSTGFSTLSGELREAPRRGRRRRKRPGFVALAMPLLLALIAGSAGVYALARHLQG